MSHSFRFAATALVVTLCAIVLASPQARAADHIVSTARLHRSLADSAARRQANVARVEAFFSSKRARRALGAGGLDLKQVKEAVPALSNQELGQLAKRAESAQNNFAAGALTNEQLTYIVIALATAVVVILIVEA
ncbi:MAG: PA2779 family protein [Terriglobia bacterium]